MTEINPDADFIIKNYNKTLGLIRKVYNLPEDYVIDQDCPPLYGMIDDLGNRYASAPASSRENYYAAFPGGLCYHNLHVLTWVSKFAGIMAPKEYSGETILKVSLLHSIGKVGSKTEDLYLPLKESWQYKNGSRFDINKKLSYMRIPQRSLHLASEYDISLTEEEYLAILLSEGQYDDANASYKYSEPKLAHILHNAATWAARLEKDYVINWPNKSSS